MATGRKSDPPPRPPRLELKRLVGKAPHADFEVVPVYRRYRFLMSDGTTVDVLAWSDDSDVRGEVVKATGLDIKGVAEVQP